MSRIGRAARRAAASSTRKTPHRKIAVHEAGHAVARVLTASDMGCKPEEAIDHIEIGGRAIGDSLDGQATLVSQACCYGMMFSREISAHLPQSARVRDEGASRSDLEETVQRARTAGADVLKWVKAKALICVFGSAAEAKLLGVPFDLMSGSFEAEQDLKDLMRDAMLAGLDYEATNALAQEGTDRALELIGRPEIWRAVLAIADRLPTQGKVEGEEVARIVARAMKEGAA